MNQIATSSSLDLPAIGAQFEGGLFGGAYYPNGIPTAIIVSTKADGDFDGLQWMRSGKNVPGACSLTDGRANTEAMAKAGSPAAKKVLDLTINGVGGWIIPALDQMTVLRATMMPRPGIVPAQASAKEFQEGGSEAFEYAWYWTSTQWNPGCAWVQTFRYGNQFSTCKESRLRVRAVRECPL